MNPSRTRLFQAISIVVGIVMAVILAEVLLSVYDSSNRSQEHMDPGLVRYHDRWGWTLSSGWQGRHSHADYDVEYAVDFRGFRESGASASGWVVLGDSYTFGLGAGNEDTFVARLNATCEPHFVNAAVPGYSPEQVALRLPHARQVANADNLLWVIYLGNDLADIGLPKPMQAPYLKPYLELSAEGRAIMKQQPVPQNPAGVPQPTLRQVVLGDAPTSILSRSKIMRLVYEAQATATEQDILEARLGPKVALFEALIAGLPSDLPMTVALLPGPSHSGSPGSLSGTYQELVGNALVDVFAQRSETLIDLRAADLDAADYHPLDGHLNTQGHSKVAAFLSTQLPCR